MMEIFWDFEETLRKIRSIFGKFFGTVGKINFLFFCLFSDDQPCWLNQRDKNNKRKNSEDYSPLCLPDGTYAPVQCHLGFCWCSTANGKMVPGTSAPRGEEMKCPRKGSYLG